MTSLVDHDVTDDACENAVDAVWFGDDFDVDEPAAQWSTIGRYPGALDMQRRPVEGAIDARHRATEPTRRRHGVLGAWETTTHEDVDTINFVPLVRDQCLLTYNEHGSCEVYGIAAPSPEIWK